MKNLIFASIALTLLLGSCHSPKKDRQADEFTSRMILKDLSDLSATLIELYSDSLRDEEWVGPDKQFYGYWALGAREELAGRYDNAIRYYRKGAGVTRYEISSNDIYLPLGRAYLEKKDYKQARMAISEYLKNAKSDLNDDDAEWGLTDSGKKALTESIRQADTLLMIMKH